MSSLADELLADLDEAPPQTSAEGGNEVEAHASSMADELMRDEEASALEAPGDDAHPTEEAGPSSAPYSSSLQALLASIDEKVKQGVPPVAAGLEGTDQYELIVRANSMAVEVDEEILVQHRHIRELYAPRFPELETLVHNPWEFIHAVRALGNDAELRCSGLEGLVPAGTIVVISMTASTTTGRPLPTNEWHRIQEACDNVQQLEEARHRILSYVESRMSLLAPNLSALIGTRIAAKLLGVAGGLAAFTKIPSCNVHLLGASQKMSTGLSSAHGDSTRFSGYLAQCDLVAQTPDDYKMQALRMVSAKASLAARMDMGRSSGSQHGEYGARLYEEIAHKIEKLLEPPPQKLIKALPVPNEGGRKQRRGGRRARKFREMHGLTELHKMQNRVEFGKEEEEAGAFDETMGLGMAGSKASGKVRAVSASATKSRISKANKERLARLNRPTLALQSTAPGSSTTAGTASSLSFTPVQGIELIDPSRQKKVDEANSKWFREGQFSLVPNASHTPTSMPPPRLPPI
ncbi:U4/U6-U5 snRNP complex subunit prp31 [Malassezia equina]|uniref:U4/U6-U5 snRNP complex subunit prp31 n=1 Tax=Malassezia equina TaxID=1381935 RepID=A0AAF0E930_9BASI|nr:U4/U6-U5 snRNP complex subunit prp31 [Malassezia equina]